MLAVLYLSGLTHHTTSHGHMLPALHDPAVARSGRPGLGREAVQRRLHSSAAQPLQAMKEAAVAVLVRHDVDLPAKASSASSESGSCAPLLTLHALVGATILRRTNGECSALRARCAVQAPSRRGHAHT